MKIYVVEGGIGRHVFFSALIPKLAKDEQIITMSSYPDIYEANPYVYRSLGRNSQYTWEDVVTRKENQIFHTDPYFNSEFIHGNIHVIESWAKSFGLEYTEDMLPELYLNSNLKHHIDNFKKEHGEFIIIQFSSGQSPINANLQQPFKWEGFQRELPLENAQTLVDRISNKYPKIKILLYGLPNEYINQLKNDKIFTIDAPYIFYAALLKEAKTFIGNNSSLMHFAGALKIPGIVLWGGSNPKQWGYNIHTNISGECAKGTLYCTRPYLRDLGDFVGTGQRWVCSNPTCMNIDTDIIMKELENFM